jgi:hypothetical protein
MEKVGCRQERRRSCDTLSMFAYYTDATGPTSNSSTGPCSLTGPPSCSPRALEVSACWRLTWSLPSAHRD